jgi:hypothetical protein
MHLMLDLIPTDVRKYVPQALLFMVVCGAFFWRLDGALLWRDEATTASWGRALSRSGSLLPSVWDGDQLVVQGSRGHDFNADFRPAMQGWLQFYVSAIGFKLFGDGTWAARFPFALIGAVGLFFFYRIYIRLNQGRAALYVAVATVASLPYLHYARQSRYYALALVVSLALIDSWLEVVRRRDGKGIAPFVKLGFCGVLLFLTNYLTFILLWSSLVVGLLVWRRKDLVVGLAATSAAVAAVVTPLLVSVHGSFIERAEIGKLAYLADYWMWFLDTLERANLLLPIVPLLVLGGYLAWRRKESVAEEGDIVAWFWLTILTTAVVVVLLNKSNGFLRYTLHLIPIAILLITVHVVWVFRIWGRIPALLFAAVLLVYHDVSPVLSHSQSILKRQLTRDDSFNGPMVAFLKERVTPGQRVAFVKNDIGMVAYFYHPEMKWCGLLEAHNPYNRPYRGKIAPEMFDDYESLDWVIVWGISGLPVRVERGYDLIWSYRFGVGAPVDAVDGEIFTPTQYTITEAESGMLPELSYFDFYKRAPAPRTTARDL